MKRKNALGIIIITIGILLIFQTLNIIPDILFKGWWTLFLIIPAFISMSRTGITIGNTILFVLGIGFLLKEQGWNFTGFFVPIIFIAVGFIIIFKRK